MIDGDSSSPSLGGEVVAKSRLYVTGASRAWRAQNRAGIEDVGCSVRRRRICGDEDQPLFHVKNRPHMAWGDQEQNPDWPYLINLRYAICDMRYAICSSFVVWHSRSTSLSINLYI
jgi:hypothetical protein